ncbi:hypothetical protein N0V88_006233 [Collariella sp. IMI 366227]|nr:hypothetical protein N0V88_006233 [Collariella sp. IMI 366227]
MPSGVGRGGTEARSVVVRSPDPAANYRRPPPDAAKFRWGAEESPENRRETFSNTINLKEMYVATLFKLKQNADPALVEKWRLLALGMKDCVPGVLDLRIGPPMQVASAAPKGYDLGSVVLFENAESLDGFATHPGHLEVIEIYRQVMDEDSSLFYDIDF